MFADKTVVCSVCGKEFVWSAREQEFFSERGFSNPPKRCKECDAARKKMQVNNNK